MTKSPWESQRERLVDNLLAVYARRTLSTEQDGHVWYPKARQIVREWSQTYNLPVNTVASVIAAISPQCDWERNLIIADDVLANRAISIGGCLGKNLSRARLIREQRTGRLADLMLLFPQGPKVNCFAWNLAGHDNIVTIDTHGIQAALDDVTATITLKWTPYRIFAECYATAAARVGLSPTTFQATIWCTWKHLHPRVSKIQARTRWAA